MANGKDAQIYTKKFKMQDHSLNKEIDSLSSELHGKLNALEKEAKYLKEQVNSKTVENDKPYIYGVDVRLSRRKSDETGIRLKEMETGRRTKSNDTRTLPRIDSEGCFSTADAEAETETPTNTNNRLAPKKTKDKPKCIQVTASQNDMPSTNKTKMRYQRRTSLNPNHTYEALGRRRGSREGLYYNEGRMGSDNSVSMFSEHDGRNSPMRSVTPRGRRLSLPSALSPIDISLPAHATSKKSALPFHDGPILNHIKAPATLYLRKLKTDLDQRKPKSLAQLRANPKTTYQEELEMDFIVEELHRSALGFVGPTIREQDMTHCRYLRRSSADRELTLDEIFDKS